MKQYYDFFKKENKSTPKREAIALLCSSYNLPFINLFWFAHFSIFSLKQWDNITIV